MKTELTLAIPTDYVWNILDYVKNGVIKISNSKIIDQLLVKGLFRHRNELEDDSLYKQLIPYAVICYKDMIYMFHRTKKQTETRLHNMYSLGVGGHMNPWGESINIKYMHHGLTRELNEEVQLTELYQSLMVLLDLSMMTQMTLEKFILEYFTKYTLIVWI